MALSLAQPTRDLDTVFTKDGRNRKEIEDIEFSIFLEAIYQRYGFDLREYEVSFLRRRIRLALEREKLTTISALQAKVLRESKCLDTLMADLCSFETELFRDPGFYLTLRQRCVPLLKTYPSIQIWVVGCSRGEELYSMAILLEEEGLLEKSKIYATDMHQAAWDVAQRGQIPAKDFDSARFRYEQSGGADFDRYWSSHAEYKILQGSLLRQVVFGQHSLITDQSFNEFHLVLCRNHFIHFKQSLHHRAMNVLRNSLVMLGFLALGERETLRSTQQEKCFEEVDPQVRLYRRIR